MALGSLSPVLLAFMAIVLVVVVCQAIAIDILARQDIVSWAERSSSKTAMIVHFLWKTRHDSIAKSPLFWVFVLIATGVSLYAYRMVK